jgi:hypothetical protein
MFALCSIYVHAHAGQAEFADNPRAPSSTFAGLAGEGAHAWIRRRDLPAPILWGAKHHVDGRVFEPARSCPCDKSGDPLQ